MVERPERAAENPEREVSKPKSVEVPPPTVAEQRASTAAMDETRQRGAQAGMRQIDGDNPPVISGSGRQGDPSDRPGSTERRPGATPESRERRAGRPPGAMEAQGGSSGGEGPPPERERFQKHKLAPGETVWSVVAARQTDSGGKPTPAEILKGVERVLEANGLNPRSRFHAGMELKIPEDVNSGVRPTGRNIPGAPTALVLDGFNGNGTQSGIVDESHGGILAKGFNAMGFNVLKADTRMTDKDMNPALGRGDYSRTMQRAGDYIEANRDKFPPGSFVNTSFGNNKSDNPNPRAGDPTFKEVSTLLKMNVNAENVAQQKEEILKRLGRVAQGRNPETDQLDPTIRSSDRKMAEAAVKTNAEIERIQKMGVEVIHSAGNDGRDRLDLNFLRATNLRADGPDGKLLGFSATGSHTEHGSGLYSFHVLNKNEVGMVVNGTVVRFPLNKGELHDRRDHVINPKAFDDPTQRTEPFVPTNRKNSPHFDVEAYKRGYEQRVYNIGPVVDFTPGTSFSPFDYVARTRRIARPPEP